MAKLYLIGVGGTGSRVMHSLTMLLASGMKINATEIVPMIIDTDVNNANLTECKNAIYKYCEIHERLFENTNLQHDGHFFHTKIRNLNNLAYDGNQFANLSKTINYDGITNYNSKKIIELLFSKENLEMPLAKGFVGNPNIGCIVLNSILNSGNVFNDFLQGFANGDRIFIISSIFGGTGAAGFPLLLNNFRHNLDITNAALINNSIIGAVTVLPYFTVSDKEQVVDQSLQNYDVDSDTFIDKAKAALAYYDKYVSNEINALYFIGDYKKSQFIKSKGGDTQRNPAYFIEVATALSVFDFMNMEQGRNDISQLRNKNNFFEFCINNDSTSLDFSYLLDNSFTKPLIKQHIFNQFFKTYLKENLGNSSLAWKNNLKIESNYYNTFLCKAFSEFYNYYEKWVKDLAFDNHARKFIPFKNISVSKDNILSLFNGVNPKMDKTILGKEKLPSVDFDTIIGDTPISVSGTDDQKFMNLMNVSIENIYNRYFNY